MSAQDYVKVVKTVLDGDDKARELMDIWQQIYGDRPSYLDGMTRDEMLIREGERRFFLTLKEIVRTQK